MNQSVASLSSRMIHEDKKDVVVYFASIRILIIIAYQAYKFCTGECN